MHYGCTASIALHVNTNICRGMTDCNTMLTFLHSVHLFMVETLLLSSETKTSNCKEGSLLCCFGVMWTSACLCFKKLRHTLSIFICNLTYCTFCQWQNQWVCHFIFLVKNCYAPVTSHLCRICFSSSLVWHDFNGWYQWNHCVNWVEQLQQLLAVRGYQGSWNYSYPAHFPGEKSSTAPKPDCVLSIVHYHCIYGWEH